MKKLLMFFVITALFLSLVGCGNDENKKNDTSNSNHKITDYALAGALNVTSVNFSCVSTDEYYGMKHYKQADADLKNADSITVNVRCPICGETTFDIIEFTEIAKNNLNQSTFTLQGEINCSNWANQVYHKDSFDMKYNYTIICTYQPD